MLDPVRHSSGSMAGMSRADALPFSSAMVVVWAPRQSPRQAHQASVVRGNPCNVVRQLPGLGLALTPSR